ncbi:MAG: hypothetical protein AB1416_08575, partial [Actinomycetota bacterium]
MVPEARRITFLRRATAAPAAGAATVLEAAGLDDARVAAALAAGLLPVETADAAAPALAWVLPPQGALALL